MTSPETDGTGKTVARNAVFLLVAKAVSTALGLVLVLFMARNLGDSQFGIYTIGLAIGGICGILADVGLNNLTTRQLARDPSSASGFLGNVISIKLLLAVPVAVCAFFILILFDYNPYTRYLILIIVANSLLFNGMHSFYYHVIEGFERMQYITILEVIKRIAYLCAGFFTIHFGYGILVFVIGLLICDGVNLLIIWWICRRSFGIRINFGVTIQKWPGLIRKALPFGLLMAFTMILSSTDVVMIGALHSEESAGWYGAAIRLISTLSLIPLMSASAMFPSVSRLHHDGPGKGGKILTDVIRPMVLMGIPVAVGTTMLAEPIVILLFKQEYILAAPALRILIWSLCLNFVSLPMVLFLSAVDRQVYATISMGLCALLNIIFNIYLIPAYGLIGASITTVISQATLLGLCYIALRNKVSNVVLVKNILQGGLASVGLWYYLTIAPSLHLIVVIGLAIPFYVLLLILVRALKKEDWDKCKHLLNPV